MIKNPLIVHYKNLIPICILQILKEHSDCDHKLTQEDIIKFLKTEYSIDSVERKSVGRTIDRMRADLEIDIESDRHGSWLETREFENYELSMLIDSVLSSSFISKKFSDQLVEKIAALGNEYYRDDVKYAYLTEGLPKTNNKSVIYNIDAINTAIKEHRQIQFDRNNYGADKKLQHVKREQVSPIRLINHNQIYYLLASYELGKGYYVGKYYRIEKLTNIEILYDCPSVDPRKTHGLETGISHSKVWLPENNFGKNSVTAEFYTNLDLETVFDYFGTDIEVKEKSRSTLGDMYLGWYQVFYVRVKALPYYILQFAISHPSEITIISPQDIKDEFYSVLKCNSERLHPTDFSELAEKDFALIDSLSIKAKYKLGIPVYLGRYPQSSDGTIRPIEWTILAVENDEALLVSKYCLECMAFSQNESTEKWANSDVRKWLMESFYPNAFSEEEKRRIVLKEILSPDNKYFSLLEGKTKQAPGSELTKDYVFLLSANEAEKYMPFSEDLKAPSSEYLKEKMRKLYEKYKEDDPSWPDYRNQDYWWLRSVGTGDGLRAALVYDFGLSNFCGQDISDENIAIRPAMWIQVN